MNGEDDHSESDGSNRKMMDESGMASLGSLDEALSVNDAREHSSAVLDKQDCLSGQCKANRFRCELPPRYPGLRSAEAEEDILTKMERYGYCRYSWKKPDKATEIKLEKCRSGRCEEKLFPCSLLCSKGLSFLPKSNSKAGISINDLPDDVLAMCITSNPLNARLVCSQWKDVVFKHHWELGIVNCSIYSGRNLIKEEIRWINRKEKDMDKALEEIKRKWTDHIGGNDEFRLVKSDTNWTILYINQDENKLTLETLPSEMLAICLSYTGRDLLNARLACRRLNQTVEEWQCMMNVVYTESIVEIKKTPQSGPYIICEVTRKWKKTTCKLDELMKYVRFFRPKKMSIDCEEIIDIKEYLTGPWRKSIVRLTLRGKESLLLLSNFPNVRELFCYFDQSVELPVLAQISAHPSPFCYLGLYVYNFNYCEENAALLEVLSVHSNKFSSGMRAAAFHLACSMEAIIRFIENAKFAEKFSLSIKCRKKCISSNANSYSRVCKCVESCRYYQLKNWLRDKGLVRSSSNEPVEFVYRSTEFWVNLV